MCSAALSPLSRVVFSANWRQAWEGVKTIFSGVFRSLVGIAAAPLNAIISAINTVIGGLNSLHVSIPKWVPKYGGQTFSLHIPTIPNVALAEGGIATAPTTALIGEGGEPEAVIPLSKLSSMLDGLTGGRGENHVLAYDLCIQRREQGGCPRCHVADIRAVQGVHGAV